MNDQFRELLKARVTNLYSAAADLSQLFASSEPLTPGVQVEMMPAPEVFKKACDLEDQIKKLRDHILQNY